MLMMDTSFHQRLAHLLKIRDISQSDLARATAVTPQSVHQWVKGESRPKGDRLKRVVEILRTNERWLLWGDGSADDVASRAKNTTDNVISYESSVAPIDRHLGRQVPLIELEGMSVPSDGNQSVELPASSMSIQSHFPTGVRSVAFVMRDRSMEPRIEQGDIVIIDPDLVPVPEDCVVVHIIARKQNVFRKFTYGTNGEVLLTPINPSYERFRFSAEEWRTQATLLGVKSEFTSPRRT
jgi:phage repressor protein C with HTH and peptisase S24 domain